MGSLDDPVSSLSGGNAQKVVLGQVADAGPEGAPARRPDEGG